VTRRRTTAFAASLVLAGCTAAEPATEASELRFAWSRDTLYLGSSLNALEGGRELEPDLTIRELPFPFDVADLPGDTFAVLDRMDRAIHVFDGEGRQVGTLGGPGAGPGEFEEPYAIAARWHRLAVWDKSGRVTVLSSVDGRVLATAVVEGDTRAIWQRVPMSAWEEPLQLSREDVTRRLAWIDTGRFGLQLQDRDERTDRVFLGQSEPRAFPARVLVFDTSSTVVDTLGIQVGQEFTVVRWLAGGSARSIAAESAFPSRPLWTSGTDWTAWSSGRDTVAAVRFVDGDDVTVVWPSDGRPAGANLLAAYVRSEVEGYRRLRGDADADEVASWPLDAWVTDGHLVPPRRRPQIMGMLGSGSCLALTGFRPEDGPHGESNSLLILNVATPGAPLLVRVPGHGFFVRALQDGAIFTVRIAATGERLVERYPLPENACVD
jgi:hypothetical protein